MASIFLWDLFLIGFQVITELLLPVTAEESAFSTPDPYLITQDGVLIEAKYYSTLNPKQQKLFDAFEAKQKYVADRARGFLGLDEVLGMTS